MSTKLQSFPASPRFVSQSANTTFDRGASEDEMPFPLCESPVLTRPDSPRLSERPSKVTIMPEVVELLEATAARREDVVGGHTVYTIKGKDSEGLFEAERRFKEFVLLRRELVERWPGVYIPPLPPKKAFGNLDPAFVEVRRHQLFSFMLNIARHPYLYRSAEYQQFLRGGANYEKCAAALECASSKRVQQRFRRYFGQPGLDDEMSLASEIQRFEAEFKWQVDALRGLKHRTQALAESYESFHNNLLGFAEEVQKAEPALRQETGSAAEFWFEYPRRAHEFDNPYAHLYNWFVMEKQECVAIYSAIKGRNNILSRRQLAIEEKGKCERKFSKLTEGKFVPRLQSRSKLKNKLEVRIEYLTDEVQFLLEIGRIATARLVKVDLPKFLERRAERYAELMREFGSAASMEFEEMLKNGLIIGSRRMGKLD